MKKILLAGLLGLASPAFAGDHSDLGLEKRQPDTAMDVTSVVLGQEVTSIVAEGDMEGYGKVYVTYHLTYNPERTGGTVDGQGRGFFADTSASGRFQGFWHFEDGIVTMRNVVDINNDTMNLDVIKFNPLTRELIIQAYILK